MSCDIMVTSSTDCPPTCTASALPSPETRFFCQQNSALIATSGQGGQGAFAGKGSTVLATSSDATLSAPDVPALATGGQQDSGGFVITQTSVQVVTVGSLTMSGGIVTATSPSFLFSSSGAVATGEPIFSTRISSTTTLSSLPTTSMSEPTGTSTALTATNPRKSFIKTTGGWVTIFLIVMVVLVGTILGALLWRRKKKIKAKQQIEEDGDANEAALRRNMGDWSAGLGVPLTGVTVAGSEYRASVPVVRTATFGGQRRLANMGPQNMTAAEDDEGKGTTTKAQSGPESGLSGGAQPGAASPIGGTTGLRTGGRAPARERFPIPSSIYSVDSDPIGTAQSQQPPVTQQARHATGASRTQQRTAKEREREWEANAISGAFDSEDATDRAVNEARARKLKMEADTTQATQKIKDSWDPTKNISAGPLRQKMKPSQGIGPKARPEPEAKVLESDLGLEFDTKAQRGLEPEIYELLDQSHPTRIEGQQYDRNAPRGPPPIPMKSVRRGGLNAGLVEVQVTEEKMEQRRKWMEAGKEERKRERDAAGKVSGRQASPIPDNDTIQNDRVEWGFGGPVKVGNPYPERVDKGGIGRTPLPISTNKGIQEHQQRRKGAPF